MKKVVYNASPNNHNLLSLSGLLNISHNWFICLQAPMPWLICHHKFNFNQKSIGDLPMLAKTGCQNLEFGLQVIVFIWYVWEFGLFKKESPCFDAYFGKTVFRKVRNVSCSMKCIHRSSFNNWINHRKWRKQFTFGLVTGSRREDWVHWTSTCQPGDRHRKVNNCRFTGRSERSFSSFKFGCHST